MISEEVLTTLKTQGIKRGDVLLVSSDVSQVILNLCGGVEYFNKKTAKKICNDIIDTLQHLIGIEGTLLFPTYNWMWCKGKPFIYEKTLGETGALGNVALKRDDFKRTKHPIYSFAVWGKDMNMLSNLENIDSWGLDSAFNYLYVNKAKNLFIDVIDFYTFTHFVEESVGVDYRYIKEFRANYVINNVISERVYTMYVRNLNLNFENSSVKLLKLLENSSCLNYFECLDVKCGIIDMYKSFDIIKKDIINNNSKNLIKYKDLFIK